MKEREIRLLLVEDDKVDQMAFERFVENNNQPYDYTIAGSIAEAKETIKSTSFDIIIADYMLGDGTSFELFDLFKDLPVVVTTGIGDEEVAVEAMKLGACDYLIKDPKGHYLKTLPATVELALKRKKTEKELQNYHEHLESMVEKRTSELQAEIVVRRQTEAALQSERDNLKNTFESIQDGIYIVDQQYVIHYVNPVLIKEFGHYEGRKCYDYFHDRDEVCPWCRAQDVWAGKIVRWEWYSSKNEITYDIVDTPITLPDGSIGKLEIFRDITDRIHAEKALKVSEEKYRGIFENAIEGFFQSTPEGRFISVNPSFAWMVGYASPEELIAGISDIAKQYYVNSEDRLHLKKLLEKNGFVEHFEIKVRCKDGSQIWVSSSARAIYDRDGKIVRYEGNVNDITMRKQTDAERERLMQASEQAMDTIIITDRDGTIQYANPAFERITGYTREEVIGKNPSVLKSGEHNEAFYKEMWDTLTHGTTWSGRIVNKKKDGTLFTEEATISPVHDTSGRTVNYVAVKRDITKEIKLEAQFHQAQKMESVGRLAGGVAHDYNNVLSVIIGFTELAIEEVDPKGSLQANLNEVLKAARRATDITRQLLAFARKQTIAPKVLDLNENVERMLKMIRRLIGEDIDLAWLPGAGLEPVKMDPSQVDQILANLCVNARDAIEGVGKVTIETVNTSFDEAYCTYHAGFNPGAFVMLAVSDNGCGMGKKVLDNIFEPFFTTKDVDKGTGLGLSTVYGIAKQNNGFVNVYSEPDKGTTVKIYLPRHEGKVVESQRKITEDIPPSCGETVLLVEDDLSLLKLSQQILDGLGYTVLSACTPGEAMGLAEAHTGKIHLLLTDVIMPEMNGRELAERLQSLCPDLKHLFMSGYPANTLVHHGVLDERVNFIQKPFLKIDLTKTVRKVLDDDNKK